MALACLWQSVLRRMRSSCTVAVRSSKGRPPPSAQRLSPRGAAGAPAEPREVMEYDVCIVGAGPAGLSAAIRLKQARASVAIIAVRQYVVCRT